MAIEKARLEDDEPSPWATTHPGQVVVLEKLDGLTEDRPAHSEALHELGLRADQLARSEVLPDDAPQQLTSKLVGALAAAQLLDAERRIDLRSDEALASQEVRLGAQVDLHPGRSSRAVALPDRVDDPGVGAVDLTDDP